VNRLRRPDAIYLTQKEDSGLLGEQFSTFRMPTAKLRPNSQKGTSDNDLPTGFIKWCEIAAERNQWRAVCGS
jgi:hypothetical protein